MRLTAGALLLVTLMLSAGAAVAESGIPAYVLQLPASVHSLLVAATDSNTLHRYEVQDGELHAASEGYISIGQNGAGKQRAWDRRTPLGIYFANDIIDTTRLHEKYGPLALPLDYPNAWDDRNARTGDGIWIHGVIDDGVRRPARDTDGCIALPNDELLRLQEHVELLTTPVIITRRLDITESAAADAARKRLQAVLGSWVNSFLEGDWHRYLSLYAPDFTYRGLSRQEWSAYRVRAGETRPLLDFTIDDVLLLADPEQDGLYLSRFRQTIVDDNGKIVTVKRLYWQEDERGNLRIVAEDNG